MYVNFIKGTYNRLALTKCYLLDIDLALCVPWLPSKVKLNKSWIYFFIVDNSFYGKLATLGHRIIAWDSSNLNDENVRVFSVIGAKWAQQPSA